MARCLLFIIVLTFSIFPFNLFASNTNSKQILIQQSTKVLFNKYYKNSIWNRNTSDKMGFWIMANLEESILNLKQKNLVTNDQLGTITQQIQSNPLTTVENNNWNDDQLWWALMLLRAYEVLPEHNKQYLTSAETIVDNTRNSSPTNFCGNGVAWKNKNSIQYKNTITNELFMLAAAKLAWLETDASKQKKYLQYAVNEWHWFFDKPTFSNFNLYNHDLSFNDGYKFIPKTNGKYRCFPEDTTGQVWTYNQGVILGGLLYLFHDLKSLQIKTQINNAPRKHKVKTKMLHLLNHDLSSDRFINSYHDNLFEQSCEAAHNCNDDQQAFKGIFMRYLAYVTNDSAATSPIHKAAAIKLPNKLIVRIKQFSNDNANSIKSFALNSDGEFDVQWGNPSINTDGSTSKKNVTATTDAAAISGLLADYNINN